MSRSGSICPEAGLSGLFVRRAYLSRGGPICPEERAVALRLFRYLGFRRAREIPAELILFRVERLHFRAQLLHFR